MDDALLIFSALAHETRIEVLRHLVGRLPAGVPAGEIARHFQVRQNTMSAHLAALSRAELVASERDGRVVRYRANLETVRKLVTFLMQDCCGGHPEVCAGAVAALEGAVVEPDLDKTRSAPLT